MTNKICYDFAWGGIFGDVRANLDIQLNNIMNTSRLVSELPDLGYSKYVFASTLSAKEALHEFNSPSERQPIYMKYGAAKFASDILTRFQAHDSGIAQNSGVIPGTYGIGDKTNGFIYRFLSEFINNVNDKSHIFNFTSGLQNYDFSYVDDIAQAFVHIGLEGKPFKQYTIGSGQPHQLRQYIESMASIAGVTADRLNFGGAAFDGINNPLSTFSTTSLLDDTEFKPSISFEDGIRKTYEWILSGEPEVEVPVLSNGQWSGNEALVTGANGFIGSATVRELLRHNTKVIALVSPRFTPETGKFRLPLNDPFLRIIKSDMNEIERLPELLQSGVNDN